MIKPHDVITPTSHATPDQLAACEAQFDLAIRQAAADPLPGFSAHVPTYRDGMPQAVIEEMAEIYRAVGWDVIVHTPTQRGGIRVTIRRP